MAKLGVEYSVDYEATDKQGGGGGILPHMYARIQAQAISIEDSTDGKGHQAAIVFEVAEPEEFVGRTFREWWTIVHPDGFNFGKYKYGKPQFDRLARAVQVDVTADTDTDELLFRTFVAEIGIREGGFQKKDGTLTKDNNQINKFFFEDDGATVPVPELGVIGDGTDKRGAKPAAANDNRAAAANDNRPAPAQRQAEPAKAAGSKPWGAKRT